MAWTALRNKDLCFLDTETTGLDPNEQEVIEVAIIRCDAATLTPRWEWATKIKPQRIETAHPKALEVNGYTAAAWADAPLFDDVAAEIGQRLDDSMIVGHNVGFDLDFLNAGIQRAGKNIRLPYHKIDTVTLAYEHLVPKGLDRLSLDTIRKFLGLTSVGAHTALVDVQQTREIYIRMCRKELLERQDDALAIQEALDLFSS